ncbi:MAG: hypothetical protein J0L75_02745 [Spirochaetes bacterium]|nr:hypothetical protein [Spirochaetota bacterium]
MPKTLAPVSALRRDLFSFVRAQTGSFVSRYAPGFKIPAYLAGYPVSTADAMPLLKLVSWLGKRGEKTVAGVPVETATQRLLRQIDGPSMEVFNSFTLSELLLAAGPFEGNPLLAGFTDAERRNVAEGCDSSHIRMQNGKPLGGRPNNYWGVLARCEWGRLQLGLIRDRTLFDECLGKVKEFLALNPEGFWDDHQERAGRYDIYSADVLVFLEPLWPELRKDAAAGRNLDRMLRRMIALGEALPLEGGISWAWGRSINGHSQSMLMELMSIGLREGWVADRPRALALVAEGSKALQKLFRDGYTSIQRDLGIERYRLGWRIFESTTDLLGKFAFTDDALSRLDPAEARLAKKPKSLWPAQDTWIPFDPDGAGVWVFRSKDMAFQLPVVAANDPASYLPFPHAPRTFENPCDNFIVCGAPHLLLDGRQYTSLGRPDSVKKEKNGLALVYDHWVAADEIPYGGHYIPFLPKKTGERRELPGRREVRLRVSGRTLVIEEFWRFDVLPAAVALDVAEAKFPLALKVDCASPYTQNMIPVEGLTDWRTVWGTVKRVHQVSFEPRGEMRLTWTVKLGR